jgi:hypothetical protein
MRRDELPVRQGKFLENGANPAVSADRGSKFAFGELKELKRFELFLSCSHRVMPNRPATALAVSSNMPKKGRTIGGSEDDCEASCENEAKERERPKDLMITPVAQPLL